MKGMIRHIGPCAAALLLLAGCSETTVGRGPGGEDAIGFTTDVTRAAKEDFAAGDAFAVWGWYAPDDAFSRVFDATKVSTPDGTSWSYEGMRFWKAGKTYAFYALHPAADALPGTASCSADGILSVAGFDASRGVDLMAACATGMDGGRPAPVPFTFTHLLTRIQIVGKRSESTAGIVGFTPRIHAVRLYGMPGKGDFSLSAADLADREALRAAWMAAPGITTSDAPLAAFISDGGEEATAEGTLLLDALPYPQRITQDCYVEVVYSTDGTGTDRQTRTVRLTSLPVTVWEAGRQYRYTFSVSDNDRILFDTPTVNAWDEAVGGIIIVD